MNIKKSLIQWIKKIKKSKDEFILKFYKYRKIVKKPKI